MKPGRRVDKLEAKHLDFESIFIRCQDPPSTKKVPLMFPGWLVFPSGVASNVWSGCQLLQDKFLAVNRVSFFSSFTPQVESRPIL